MAFGELTMPETNGGVTGRTEQRLLLSMPAMIVAQGGIFDTPTLVTWEQ
jgi:hypothetical protein